MQIICKELVQLMFNLIDIGGRAGIGFPALFSVWEKEGWEDPVIEERYGEVVRTTSDIVV